MDPTKSARYVTPIQLCGVELVPVSIELMGDVERAAALAALADLYGSIPRPFQVLSVLAERDPGEHLAIMSNT